MLSSRQLNLHIHFQFLFIFLQGELAELDKIRQNLYSKHAKEETHEDFSDDEILDQD